MKYKLFTTQFCHKCPSMKEFMTAQDNIGGEVVNCSVPEGMEEARKFNVTAVPLVVFVDDSGSEVKRFESKEEVEEFLNTL